MKIIKEHSVLRYLPSIDRRTLLILDGVRFCGEIIDNSYTNLERCLLMMSDTDGQKPIPETFQYAWNIVDHSQRLLSFLKLLPSESNHFEVELILKKVKVFRNTFQHLDARIDESLLNNNHPVFGKLKWCMSYPGERIINCIAVSGAFISNSHLYRVGTYNSIHKPTEVILESVDKNKVLEFDMTSHMLNLQELVKKLEEKLYFQFDENKIDLVDRSSTTDILILMVNGDNSDHHMQ